MNLQLGVHVPKSEDLDQLIHRFTHKLEPQLFAFNPDLVQLQGRIIRHREREGVVCSLNLHLPTGQLSSEAAAPVAQQAFRVAGAELLRRFHTHMERLRDVRPRARRGPGLESPLRVNGHAAASASAPPAESAANAEQLRRDDLAAYLARHLPELAGFVARQLRYRERMGDLAHGEVDPREVLDEVVVMALTAPAACRNGRDRGRWFRLLAAQAVDQLARSLRASASDTSLDDQPRDDLQPRLQLDDWAEPAEDVAWQDLLAAPAATPESIAYAEELIDRLAAALRSLPPAVRNDWVLARIEGFQPAELAVISQRTLPEVEASIHSAELTLPDITAAIRQFPLRSS